MDHEQCFAAVLARDSRFDGTFFTAVTSTGIYCRPSCPARTPGRDRAVFYKTAAAAAAAGYRPCKRCRPDAAPGSPEWNLRADRLARGLRLIEDGLIDRTGVAGLARALCLSERQLHRLFVGELGVGPLALARTQRAGTARALLEQTDLPVTAIAFAAGFSSVRQFNDTIREVYQCSPREIRSSPGARGGLTGPSRRIRLRLAYRTPIDLAGLFGFLARRAVPGLEVGSDTFYRRVLALPHEVGTVTLSGDGGSGGTSVSCALELGDLRDLGAAVHRCRRLLDLDADPSAVLEVLGHDPVIGGAVTRQPGRRIPGHPDGDELALRAVCGQQVSVDAASRIVTRLLEQFGTPLASPADGLSRAFPGAAVLAEADDLPLPPARAAALRSLAAALASGEISLGPGADREAVEAALLRIPGIGPWTAASVRMRALGDPDAFLPGDLAVRRGLDRLGHPGDRTSAARIAEAWRPYRAYGLVHLWAVADEATDARLSSATKAI